MRFLSSKRWRERKMRGSTWGKSCVTCLLIFLVLVLCRRGKKEKGRPLILWGQPSPLLCNQGHLMAESQFKDCNPTTSPHILPWDLSWSSFASFLLSPRRHNQIQNVITKSKVSYPQVDGVMVKINGVDQPINLAISFAQDEITPIQGTGGFVRH
jgi:hypothetical protein